MTTTATPPELIAIEDAPAVAERSMPSAVPGVPRELPSLDGLRSMARIAILCGHMFHGKNHTSNAIFNRIGDFGVCVFFGISGYLITTVIWKDARRNGRVNLAKFYFRRTLRIFPPFYVYLAIVAIGGVIGVWTIPAGARWWPAIFFLGNVVNPNDWLVGHAWSLAVEEQFYLMWPIAFAYFIRKRGKVGGVQMGAKILIGALCALPVIRILAFGASRSGALADGLMFDYVAAGSGMALVQETEFFERQRAILAARWGRLLPYTGLLALTLHVIFAGTHRWMFAVDVAFSTTVEAILLAIFLAWATRHPEHPIGRVLNIRALRMVGVASYSLYLYQQLFFEEEAPFHWPVPVGLAALCACAAISYWLVEVPSLRFRVWAEGILWPAKQRATGAATAARA